MKDIELAKLFGLPTSTIADWKNKKNLNRDVKYLLYKFISTLPDEIVKERIEAIKLLEDIEVVGKQEFINDIFTNKDKFDIFDGYDKVISQDIVDYYKFKNSLRGKVMFFMKNDLDEYILMHFYLPYNSNSFSRIEYVEQDYQKFQKYLKINKIYLVLSGVELDKLERVGFCKSIDNLEIIDASYFSEKLYDRKNIIFWNDPNTIKK